MKKILLLILIFTACTADKSEYSGINEKYYSVRIASKDEKTSQDLIHKLSRSIADTVFNFEKDKKYITQIGFYESVEEAADKGFELYADSLIDEYNIYHKDSLLENPYNDFYFVGRYLDRPSLYKLNLLSKKVDLEWSKWGRKIIEINRASDNKIIFIPAALSWGRRAGFPYITNMRLYFFNDTTKNVNFVRKFGNGLGVHSAWENDTTFALYFTVLDSFATSTVYQKKYEYDRKGRLTAQSDKKFDLLSDGIQFPDITTLNPVSLNLTYRYDLTAKDSIYTLVLENIIDGSETEICSTRGQIITSKWTEDESFLFLRTSNIENSNSTDLLVVRTKENKLINKFNGVGEKNFVIRGNLLIFDDGFDKSSHIIFYRYKKNKIYHRIRLSGGCGVRSIPSRERIF